MKKTIKLAVVAALALGTTSAFATNGDNMIGQGAKSRGMGGVGVATAFGAESGLANPAMIKSVKGSEITGAITVFMPNVDFASNAMANAMPPAQGGAYPGSATVPSSTSSSDLSVIPEIAYATRVNDSFVYGLSMTGTAGMGVDFKGGNNGAADMQTELAIMKIAVPMAYTVSGFTIGATPVLQYGTLQINYATPSGASSNPKSSDTGFGFEVGAAYETGGITLGLVYKSQIDMEYEKNIASAMTAFGVASVTSGDKLSQPAEMGVGISYSDSGSTFAIDYRSIAWGEADGYKDFGWEDQSVIAVGYEYATNDWAVRVGYNHGKSPITEQDSSSMAADAGKGYDNGAVNFFNLAGFPGVVESHITLGGSLKVTNDLTFDGAFVYASEVDFSYDTTGMTQGMVYQGAIAQGAPAATAGAAAGGASASSADVTHSQSGFTLALNYKF